MAITQPQRQIAINAILRAYGEGDTAVGHLLPGAKAADVATVIATAIGTTVDPQLTAVLNQLKADTQAQLTRTQTSVSSLQTQIASYTIT